PRRRLTPSLLALGLVPAACTRSPGPAPQDTPGSPGARPGPAGPLRIAIGADEGSLQPYTYVTGYPGYTMLTLVYDTLFVLDADNIPQPWLATADAVSEDGRVHTLTLRRGVTWHDGRPFTSADVTFSFEYYRQHTHARWTPRTRGLVGVEAPDAATVVLS